MRLEDFEGIGLERGDLFEARVPDSRMGFTNKAFYFQKLVKERDDRWREGDPEPPYVRAVTCLDKNSCPSFDHWEKIRVEDIRWAVYLERKERKEV